MKSMYLASFVLCLDLIVAGKEGMAPSVVEVEKSLDPDNAGSTLASTGCATQADIDVKQGTMEDYERIAYKILFDNFDGDKDGKIEFNEFETMMQKLGEGEFSHQALADSFNALDKNKNRCIDFDEFMRLLDMGTNVLCLPSLRTIFEKEFKKHDLNGDGFLTKRELQFAAMGLSNFMSSDQAQTLIDKMDYNSDGKADFNEFIALVPELYKNK